MLYIMLVGRYPFERPGDTRFPDLNKNQMVIQRILRRDVEFPATLSSEVRDLLDKLLTLDPNKRITIPEIQAHPWYVLCVQGVHCMVLCLWGLVFMDTTHTCDCPQGTSSNSLKMLWA